MKNGLGRPKGRAFAYLRVIVSLLLVGALLWLIQEDLANVLLIIQEANLSWFIAAFILNLFIMLLLSMRIRLVFGATGVNFSLREAAQLTFVGYFFNNFLPTSAGGDVVKAYYGIRMSRKGLETASAILADRLFGIYGLFLLAAVGVIFYQPQSGNDLVKWLIWLITGSFTIGFLYFPQVLRVGKRAASRFHLIWIGKNLDLLTPVAENYALGNTSAIGALAYSVFTKLLSVIAVYLLTLALNLAVPFGTLVWLVPVAFAVSLMPSINGLGFREGALVFFLGPLIGNDSAFAVAVLWLGVYLFTDIIGGLIYAFSPNLRNPEGNSGT
jgi:glycosyltransferase 2 family protein